MEKIELSKHSALGGPLGAVCNNEIDLNIMGYHVREVAKAHLEAVQKKINEIFEYALRNVAVPPIKGKITKGKIRWRGITLVQKNGYPQSEWWLEQRGRRISQVICFITSYVINGNNNNIK